MSKGPIAAAEVFRLMTEAVFNVLLATSPDHCSQKTIPLSARNSEFHYLSFLVNIKFVIPTVQ